MNRWKPALNAFSLSRSRGRLLTNDTVPDR